MSAELLREAAALMRERAEAATSAPWEHDGDGEVGRYSRDLGIGWMVAHPPLVADAEHIASWHPAVALAVADWLDMQAGCVANYGPNADSPWVKPHTQMALAVARAYLGSAS